MAVELAAVLVGAHEVDTDADKDGIPDVTEDADRDGRVGPGESDPHRAGLWPGRPPHIPEPLSFDLVRGLGARAGELEINVLGSVGWGIEPDEELELAPEVEWAPVDNVAVEAEAAIHGGRLAALKFAAQGSRARSSASNYIDGWQVLTRAGQGESSKLAVDLMVIYIGGLRYGAGSPWSSLVMLGVAKRWEGVSAPKSASLLVNPSLFYDAQEWLTVGLETNLRYTPGEQLHARALPQLHLQLARHVRVQAGIGLDVASGPTAPDLGGVAALRITVER